MTNEEREKAVALAIEVFEYQIKRSEDVKCRKCDECGANPFEDYCIKDVAKWLSLALEALKQEPCEDAINRKELVKWLENIQPTDGKELGVLFDVREHVKKMPPVTPAREHGEWTDEVIEKQGNKLIECMTTEACKIAKGNIDMARKILAGKISEEEEKQLIFGADVRKEQSNK